MHLFRRITRRLVDYRRECRLKRLNRLQRALIAEGNHFHACMLDAQIFHELDRRSPEQWRRIGKRLANQSLKRGLT